MKRRQWVLVAIGILWLCAVATGLRILLDYKTTPGVAAAAPGRWPADTPIRRDRGRATLIILAHPHCPCTQASIGELALLMAQVQGRVSAYVLFFKPTGYSEEWEKSDLWRSAAAIPGVTVLGDDGGIEAVRFHAPISGQTLLYDAEGRLLFSGGITASRGHAGDNAGRSAIVSLLTTGVAERIETPIFGCSLHDPSAIVLQSDSSWKK